MNSSYQPHLISNIKTGLVEGLEPWLLPKDAFTLVKNGYIRRGVLKKRLGYTLWGKMVEAVADEAIGSSGSTNYTGTLTNTPLRPGDLSIDDGTQVIDDDGDGTLSGDGSGTIDYTTGAYDVTFDATTTGAVTADYDYYPGDPVVGIESYFTAAGGSELLLFDTERMNKYDSTASKLEYVAAPSAWTGSGKNRMSAETWQDVFYCSNNVDRIRTWNGTAIANFDADIDGGGNDIDTCALIFVYKERLVLLRPTESGSNQPQRARWCAAGNPSDWTNDGYVDAPTLDWIMAADFLGDDLIVFFERSIWRLRYTGDSDLPFRWEQIVSTEGCYSPDSLTAFSDEILGLSATSMIACDGMDAYAIDEKIPDAALAVSQTMFDWPYAVVAEEIGQMLLSYPTLGASANDESLVLNYQEDSWSKFDYGFNCYGYFEVEEDLTLDDIDETWDEIEYSWDDRSRQGGFPTTLGGDVAGGIYTVNQSSGDDGAAIALEILSARWNPYVADGMQARLGFVDFYVTRDSGITFTVDFYAGKQPVAYQSITVTCDSDLSTEDKVWLRIPSGMTADFHRIRITNSAVGQTLEIHAITPWFKPAGRLI